MSEATSDLPAWVRGAKKPLATLFIALAVGPPVNGAIAGLAMILERPAPVSTSVMALYLTLPIMMVLSYWAVGFYALVYGFILASFGWYLGRLPIWSALIGAAVICVLTPLGAMPDRLLNGAALVLVPALVVWWLARRLWMRVET